MKLISEKYITSKHRTGLVLSDARACLERSLEICPNGIPLSEFEQRGHFGDYFTHMIETHKAQRITSSKKE